MPRKSKVQMNQSKKSQNQKGQASKRRVPSSKVMSHNRDRAIQASVAAAYSTGSHQVGPKIVRQKDGSIRIKNRELITNITGQTQFGVQSSFPLNPGLPSSFPWLSSIASSFEKYKFHELCYEYLTRTGSTTAGSVLMVPDYDSSDAAPLTEQIASTYQDMVEDAPWKDIRCRLQPKRLNGTIPQKFVRNSAPPASSDIKLYDSGILNVATVDAATDSVPFGKLWVCYDVELYIPQLPPNGLPVLMGSVATSGGTVSTNNVLGTTPTIDAQTFGVTYSRTPFGQTYDPGDWLVVSEIGGTQFVTAPSIVSGGGISNLVTEVNVNTGSTTSYIVQRFRSNAGVGLSSNLAIDYSTVVGATVTSARMYAARAPLGALF